MTEKEFKKYIGNRIQQRRQSLHISQVEFGKRMNLHVVHLSRIENGHNFRLSTIFKIATELGIAVRDLMPL